MSTNLFTRFKKLLQPQPQRIGTVLSVVGTALVVQELGGGTARVVGEGTVGQQVYFQGNTVVGPAPSLPQDFIEE